MSRLACLVALLLGGTAAWAECRQALALGLDVSGSVDAVEYRLQLDGLAWALEETAVQAAFLADPASPVRLMVFEWSHPDHQRVVTGWTDITTAARLDTLAARLRASRAVRVDDPATAIGSAMIFGARALAAQSDCWQKTLDLSGDGPSNSGRAPRELGPDLLGDIMVNGLVIGPQARSNTTKNLSNVKSLLGYYRSVVLRGPGAFAETALDHADFAQAMKRKLLREIAPPALSWLSR